MIGMIPAVQLRLKLHREGRQSAKEEKSFTAKKTIYNQLPVVLQETTMNRRTFRLEQRDS